MDRVMRRPMDEDGPPLEILEQQVLIAMPRIEARIANSHTVMCMDTNCLDPCPHAGSISSITMDPDYTDSDSTSSDYTSPEDIITGPYSRDPNSVVEQGDWEGVTSAIELMQKPSCHFTDRMDRLRSWLYEYVPGLYDAGAG